MAVLATGDVLWSAGAVWLGSALCTLSVAEPS
jgi:hypothetical protein